MLSLTVNYIGGGGGGGGKTVPLIQSEEGTCECNQRSLCQFLLLKTKPERCVKQIKQNAEKANSSSLISPFRSLLLGSIKL